MDAFTLVVPTDDRYSGLAPEVAARYAELAGGSATSGEELAAAVTTAIRAAASHGDHVELAFTPAPGRVTVLLTCNGHRQTVDVAVPA